jgi:hypothetical protein
MSTRFVVGKLAITLVLFASTAAWALDKKPEVFPPVPDAEEVIRHCHDISELRATPNTSAMNSGHALTIRCLGNAIQENLAILTGRDYFEESHDFDRPQPYANFLAELFDNLDRFYGDVHYGPKACSPFCGTIASTLVLSDIVNIYEEMLRDVLASRTVRRS